MRRTSRNKTNSKVNDGQGRAASLASVPHGSTTRVVRVNGSGAVALRLMEMGVVPGAPICVVRTAPLGDPIQICIRNYHLALRRIEAETITVQEVVQT
jgi:Fe2+ transport system protein FeoA